MHALGQFPTSYVVPPGPGGTYAPSYGMHRGPGGVFGIAATPGAPIEEFNGYFVRGSWSGGVQGQALQGVIARKAAAGEDMRSFQSVRDWAQEQCRAGMQVFAATPASSALLGAAGPTDRALMATRDANVIASLTTPDWLPGATPMQQVACPGPVPGVAISDAAVRAAAIAGLVVGGLWIASLGIHFLTEKK